MLPSEAKKLNKSIPDRAQLLRYKADEWLPRVGMGTLTAKEHKGAPSLRCDGMLCILIMTFEQLYTTAKTHQILTWVNAITVTQYTKPSNCSAFVV